MNISPPWDCVTIINMNQRESLPSQKALELPGESSFLDKPRCVPRNCIAKTPLPVAFQPGPYSVVIGRGKACTEAVGNRRLRVLAVTLLPQYKQCTNKIDKTAVVSRLVDMVREACPTGAFVKQIDGRWWECDGHACREKVGYVLRDLLHERYRSSSKAKVARRRDERLRKRGRLIVDEEKNPNNEASETFGNARSQRRREKKQIKEQSGESPLVPIVAALPSSLDDKNEKHTTEREGNSDLASFLTFDHTTSAGWQLHQHQQPTLPARHLFIDTQPDDVGDFPDDISEIFTSSQHPY